MILAALGTDEHPFERALDLIGALRPSKRIVVQHGHTPPRDWPDVEWHEFIDYDLMVSLMREADVVVCHGGVGTIMTTLALGKRPVVIPRLAVHGEHVDDHQLQIVERLTERALVIPVLPGADITSALLAARTGPAVQWHQDGNLRLAVAAAVRGAE